MFPIDVAPLGLEVPLGGGRRAPRPALRAGAARGDGPADRGGERARPPSPASRISRGGARCAPTSSTRLADAGALAGFGRTRREPRSGRSAKVARPAGALFDDAAGRRSVAAARDDAEEETVADYRTDADDGGPASRRALARAISAAAGSLGGGDLQEAAERPPRPDGGRRHRSPAARARRRDSCS